MNQFHRSLIVYVVLAMLITLTNYSLQAAPEVLKRDLPVHGPFKVSTADLQSAGISSNTTSIPTPPPSSPFKIQTVAPTTNFVDVTGLSGIDPGIAVGNSYILVCDNGQGLAVYDKTGNLLGPKNRGSFPNPFSISSLFAKVKADIDPLLNYPAKLPPNFSVANGNGITAYGDVRVMFDSYRNRFWVYAMAKNAPPWDAASLKDYPAVKLVRRDKAAVAVSITEDPRDGFYTYWWNNTIHNGDSNDPNGGSDPSFKTSGEGPDYPSIGISPKYFLATIGVNRRDPTFETKTATQATAWNKCKTKFVADGKLFDWCGPFYIHMMVVDADALADNCPSGPCADGRSFAVYVHTDNKLTDRADDGDFYAAMTRGMKPVVTHCPAPCAQSADAYFVNNFVARGIDKATQVEIDTLQKEIESLQQQLAESKQKVFLIKEIKAKQIQISKLSAGPWPKYYIVLWSLKGNNFSHTLYPIKPFNIGNYNSWSFLLNASHRDGKLYGTFQTCAKDAKGKCFGGVRAIRVNTLNGKTEIDHTFGLFNALEDKSTDRFQYIFPAVAVNKSGDMVFVYGRWSPTVPRPQEVRFSVWYHDEPDIRPDRLLQAGEAPYSGNVFGTGTDTAGIAVDPDDEAIWIAHIFAAKNASGNGVNRIAIGKVFGQVLKP